jgi:tetratricopeptide (TPR) repeat protein
MTIRYFAQTRGDLTMNHLTRTAAATFLIALCALPAIAQDATPTATPEPLPNCPAFSDQPNNVRTGYYMGEGIANLNANRLDEAELSFTCIIRITDPNYVQAYLGRALVYEDMRDFKKALDDYNSALQHDPNSLVGRNNRGIVLTIVGDYDTAGADFDRVLKADAKYLPAVNNRAIIYTLKGDYESATTLIDKGITASGVAGLLAQARDPKRTSSDDPLAVDPNAMQLYALKGILESSHALDSFHAYADLANASANFADDRIISVAGSLESRLTFDLRLDDGTWMIRSDFRTES